MTVFGSDPHLTGSQLQILKPFPNTPQHSQRLPKSPDIELKKDFSSQRTHEQTFEDGILYIVSTR